MEQEAGASHGPTTGVPALCSTKARNLRPGAPSLCGFGWKGHRKDLREIWKVEVKLSHVCMFYNCFILFF